MSDDFDFNSALPAKLKSINHNTTDHARYRREQEEMEKNFQLRTPERIKAERVSNLRLWDSKVPARWRGASVSKLSESARDRIMEIASGTQHSLYLAGPEGSGKTYAAYAYIRRLVGRGKALPSHVKVYAESELVEHAHSGFAGRDALQAIMDEKNASIIVLDGIGFVDDYTDRGAIAIERLITKAYTENSTLIATGSVSPADWVKRLSESTEGKLRELFGDRIVTLDARHVDQTSF